MDKNQTEKYIQKIVLQIDDQNSKKIKFDCSKFNPREAAYVFLRQYDQGSFVRGQKITIPYDGQDLHLYVRQLFYEDINPKMNTNVEFFYRKGMFSEIRWPTMNIYRVTRVRWAKELTTSPVPKIHCDAADLMNNEESKSSPSPSKLPDNVDGNETLKHFRSSIFLNINRLELS